MSAGPTHFSRLPTDPSLCGVRRPLSRSAQTRQVSCIACLLYRLEALGVAFPTRALVRTTDDDARRVVLLRRACKSALRLLLWKEKNR